MNMLSRLRLRTKLALLMGLFVLALIGVIAVAGSLERQSTTQERIDKQHALVQAAIGIAQSLEARVTAQRLTREQALGMLRDDIHAMRFDNGTGYIYVQTLDNMVVVHGANQAMEGKPLPARDGNGRLLTDLIRDALRSSDEGVVSYVFPKPGETQPQRKISYAIRFAPWNLVFVSGAYLDDVDAASAAALLKLSVGGGFVLAITLLVAWFINRDITGSLGRLKAAMEVLARGELDVEIPGTTRRDEVGTMAAAVVVFQEHMVKAERLATEQAEEREHAQAAKHAALLAMAETIEGEAKSVLAEVGRRTEATTQAADGMSASATRTGVSAQSAASAAGQALATAQTVASAAEQLASSIREIGGQVSQSSAVVGRAVEAGQATRETIGALNEQVGRIGAVADMISEIAARTNLLALNATIEAARAGDAGKGFAVVASEVKQLATQTAKSTEEISRHIAEVRSATGASVASVRRIEETIGEINAIAGSIAAAVEQQGAATAEIARNVAETAAAANEMSNRTQEVFAEADRTGIQAIEVRENTAALGSAMQDLHKTVIHLVRTATSEVDRRRYRRRPCRVEVALARQGSSESAILHDISERGCYATTDLRLPPGQGLDVTLTRLGICLQGTVAEQSEGGLHISFLGDGLTAAQADEISLKTIAELVQNTKNDHVAFVKRVVDLVATGEIVPPDSLASPHHCRLGLWYDAVSDTAAMALPSFRQLKKPHEAVHELGRRALIALAAEGAVAAERYIEEVRSQSEQVLRLLDAFGREYPTTFTQQAAA